MANGLKQQVQKACLKARALALIVFAFQVLPLASIAAAGEAPSAASSDPSVQACEALKNLEGKSLTGYSIEGETAENDRLRRYRKVYLENSSISSGAPRGLQPRGVALIQGASIRYLARYIKSKPNYPGLDVRIVSTEDNCKIATVSLRRDPNSDAPIHETPAELLKRMKYRIVALDPKFPMSVHLTPLDAPIEGMERYKYSILPDYAYIGANLDLNLGGLHGSIDFEMDDMLPLQLELIDHLMAKPLINDYRIRFHWSKHPEGDANWLSQRIQEQQASLSRKDRESLQQMTFSRFRH